MPVARGCGGATHPTSHPLNLTKRPLFATKWAKNGVLWGVSRLGPKGPLSRVPHLPKIESGNGPSLSDFFPVSPEQVI